MFGFLGVRDASKLKKRCEDLEERLEKAERTLASLDLEFNELYDKTRHALGRMAKRPAMMAEPANEAGGHAGARDSAPSMPPGLAMALQDIKIRRGGSA
jgi:hypothetical protein